MDTEVIDAPPADLTPPRQKTIWGGVAWGVLGLSVLSAVLWIAHNARPGGVITSRIANPNVTGVPQPVRPLFGDPHWMAKIQLGTVATVVICVVAFVVYWRRHPKHPVLLMLIAATVIVAMDPTGNWSPYAVYNPQLWHYPDSWAWASLSPTIEPYVATPYATFYVLPFFPGIWLLRKIQRKRPVDSFVWRHPLISLGVVVFFVGFIYDAFLEDFCIRAGLYIYSQVVPFGSIFTGKAYQFPLLWESSLITLIMIPAAVLLYRDDTGKTQAEKLAQRFKAFNRWPALATFGVMSVILIGAYGVYDLGFATIRWTHTATSVACPYPYPESKVYDPNGFYAKAGQPGPYSAGIWDTYMSAQSHGRPDVATNPDGRCSPQNVNK